MNDCNYSTTFLGHILTISPLIPLEKKVLEEKNCAFFVKCLLSCSQFPSVTQQLNQGWLP